MSKATLILVILVATLQIASHVSSQPTSPSFRFAFCRNSEFGNYTTNSAYEDNLKTALSELEDQASTFVFYNSSSGSGASTVHAQYYCREDVSAAFCSQCIQAASAQARNCSNAKAAIVWYQECTLRYMNQSMYGFTENDLILNSYGLSNMTSPDEFSGVLNDTMNGLIQEAAEGNRFATAEKTVSVFATTYFLVQCSPDLNSRQCQSCLLTAFNETQTCCGQWPIILYSFAPSCQVMYNTVRIFYFTPNAPPPPPAISATPPPPPLSETSEPSPSDQVAVLHTPPSSTSNTPNINTGSGGSAAIRSSESMKVTIITIALVVLVLVLHT